ncbi:MAG TPA: N-acetylmuramoyl-L-alanine amidase [Kofleriaceae bacterium]|jgi:N-acetylmuramoyl-L-alanine amidase
MRTIRPLALSAILVAAVAVSDAAPDDARPAPAHKLVVIDPGHGGSNAGTHAPARSNAVPPIHEKELTLAIANQVADRLRADGITVEMTRTGDRTLTLRQRVARADELDADLFISIHANASPTRTQHGYETYVLTPRGVDVDARALRGDTRTTRPAGVDAEMGALLDDVERASTQWESADLAARMQHALRDRRGKDGDRGVRQDAHHVLLGATMPAVLVEVGFLDHPIEGKELVDPVVQSQIADALAQAIEEQLDD